MSLSLKKTLDQRYFKRSGIRFIEIDNEGLCLRSLVHDKEWVGTYEKFAFEADFFEDRDRYWTTLEETLENICASSSGAPAIILLDDCFVRHAPLPADVKAGTNFDEAYIHWLAERFLGIKSDEYCIETETRGQLDIRVTAYPRRAVMILEQLRARGAEISAALPKSSRYLLNTQFHGNVSLVLGKGSWALLAMNRTGQLLYYRSNRLLNVSTAYLHQIIASAQTLQRCLNLSTAVQGLFIVVEPGFEVATEAMSQNLLSGMENVLALEECMIDRLCINLSLSGQI